MELIKKSRKECFFGLHFDFHAMPGDTVGDVVDLNSIEQMLDRTKPDMIQIDTKGHAGYSSYATKAGVCPEKMNMDVLRVWRELTAKRGIRLYAHHSGLYDEFQASVHPEWAVVSEDGTVSKEFMSPFSPYADEVLIPQMLEMAGEYGADGVWVDGDCWCVFVDYSEYAQNAWRAQEGREAPRSADPDFNDYKEFCREGFRKYVAHYIDAVKAEYPDFEITSNWMYSHYMPEKRSVNIDYISGDFTCFDSVRMVREAARVCAAQGITWDLLAWGQNSIPLTWKARNRCTKEAAQLCQEASVVLSLGGGFQFFNILYGNGGVVQEWAIEDWVKIADFCREREKYCFKAESLSDLAVIYPKHYGKSMFIGSAWGSVSGWVSAVMDVGYSCDVVNEADIKDLTKYKAVILPTAAEYDTQTLKLVSDFAQNGGTVIADGGVGLESGVCGAEFSNPSKQLIFADGKGKLAPFESNYYETKLVGAEALLDCYKQNFYYAPDKQTASVINNYGKGKVVSLCFELGSAYHSNISVALKRHIKAVIDSSGYIPFASVSGSAYANVIPMLKNGRLMLNLINMAGDHATVGVRAFDEIPEIGHLKVMVHTDKKFSKAVLRPEGIEAELLPVEGGFELTVEKLHIHSVIEIY
ncbi:MAG: beta-galactosidase trimerization domain-containing protein [Clostridia bacterium]|nr:beta-galactosidase trimerization domain-containing protein [Clostridia bacterium]